MPEGYLTRLYLNLALRGSRRVQFRTRMAGDAQVSESALLAGPTTKSVRRGERLVAILQAYFPSRHTSEIDSTVRFVKSRRVSLARKSGDCRCGALEPYTAPP
jgi:hypothetical protein